MLVLLGGEVDDVEPPRVGPGSWSLPLVVFELGQQLVVLVKELVVELPLFAFLLGLVELESDSVVLQPFQQHLALPTAPTPRLHYLLQLFVLLPHSPQLLRPRFRELLLATQLLAFLELIYEFGALLDPAGPLLEELGFSLARQNS